MGVIDELFANNEAFAARVEETHLPVEPSRHLAIVTCMDSRLDVFAALGLGDGEAHVLRNAGGVITDDVIRSLALSQRKLGTREVMLIHHDDCGLQKITEGGFRAELQEASGVDALVRDRVLHRRRGRRAPVDPAGAPLRLPPPPRRGARLRLRRRHRTRCARSPPRSPAPARSRSATERGRGRPLRVLALADRARRRSPAAAAGWAARRWPPTVPSGGPRAGPRRAGAAS